MALGREGGVGEHWCECGMLVGGLIWAEEDYRGGSAASFELVGARVDGGGVLEVLGRERARQGGESDAGLLQVLGRARVGEPRLCTVQATAAARWWPQSSLGVAWRGEEGYSAWGVGPEAAEVPREAADEAGGGLRPPSAAGGGAQRRRR